MFDISASEIDSSLTSAKKIKQVSFEKKCWNDINFKKVEYLLRKSNIEKKINLPNKGGVFLLIFKNGLKAIFKPERDILEQASALRAYHLSQLLNLKIVPPTTIRTIDNQTGIIQFFVEGKSFDFRRPNFNLFQDPVLFSKTFIKTYIKKWLFESSLEKIDFLSKNNAYILYFIFGEWDSHEENIIIGKNCRKISLIDNDTSMTLFSIIRYGGYPYIRIPTANSKQTLELTLSEYKSFPFNQVKSIAKVSSVDEETLRKIFVNINLPTVFTNFFPIPKIFYKDTLYYIKWKNAFWIKYHLGLEYIYTDTPAFISKHTFKKLKNLNHDDLQSISAIIKNYLGDQWEEKNLSTIIDSQNKLVLYRRDILLENLKNQDQTF